jgi:hypothetical protein
MVERRGEASWGVVGGKLNHLKTCGHVGEGIVPMATLQTLIGNI